MLSFRNLSEKTETAPPSFPRRRESRLVGTETYRENGFFRCYVLDSRFRGNDGIKVLNNWNLTN
ncbi:pilS cassette [Neisseria meningitidis]|nr:pilS cassette [Neisseria meningitidis]RQK58717.1 pilS cassette [Neisseria meningitidis]RQK78070.1 pilS cassette [Neisseria meningitidis]